MAVDRQPVLKRCKALGISPMVLGYSKETNRHAKDVYKRQGYVYHGRVAALADGAREGGLNF